MLVHSNWKYVLNFYNSMYGYSKEAVDFIAVSPVLNLVCNGLSNRRIASRLGFSLEYVDNVVDMYFMFEGWRSDLIYSPQAIYRYCDSFEDFKAKIIALDTYEIIHDSIISTSFILCKKFKYYKEKYKHDN